MTKGIYIRKKTVWNKGLTKETDERVMKNSKKPRWNEGKIGYKYKKKYNVGEKNYFYGKHHTLEVKQLISKLHKGRKLSDKHKEKISKTLHSPGIFEKLKDSRAKQIFPLKDTSIEVKIQNFLKQLQIEYFTHQYIHIAHGYQCDIFIPAKNLVIECDGNYWHSYPTGTELDNIRTKELIEKGFKVLRLWEIDIRKMNVDDFKNKLETIN